MQFSNLDLDILCPDLLKYAGQAARPPSPRIAEEHQCGGSAGGRGSKDTKCGALAHFLCGKYLCFCVKFY